LVSSRSRHLYLRVATTAPKVPTAAQQCRSAFASHLRQQFLAQRRTDRSRRLSPVFAATKANPASKHSDSPYKALRRTPHPPILKARPCKQSPSPALSNPPSPLPPNSVRPGLPLSPFSHPPLTSKTNARRSCPRPLVPPYPVHHPLFSLPHLCEPVPVLAACE
jgi:hypothetical protein